jgi:DNA-binding CsgD family transcriptional regulator
MFSLAFALQPSMRSTIDTALANALDAIGQGIVLYDADGELVYRNDWTTRALRLPSGATLTEQLADFVRELMQVCRFQAPGEHVVRLATRDLPAHTRPARRFIGSYLGDHFFASGSGFLISIETSTHVAYSLDELRARFQLTAAEARIAFYIAQDLSTTELSQVLSISPHTVRRHIERVLRKLGADSRSAVARILTTA